MHFIATGGGKKKQRTAQIYQNNATENVSYILGWYDIEHCNCYIYIVDTMCNNNLGYSYCLNSAKIYVGSVSITGYWIT